MKVKLGVSNRHVHLTEENYRKLFGDEPLNVVRYLNQPGQFASDKFVTLKNGDREIKHVRVLGPIRDYSQVEISRTDSYTLKLDPPIRNSADLKDSAPITIVNEENGKEVHLDEGCIIATRHLHVHPDEAKEYGLEDAKKVKIRINGEKSGILENVHMRISKRASYELHLDTDDGNAFNVKTGDEVEIIEIER